MMDEQTGTKIHGKRKHVAVVAGVLFFFVFSCKLSRATGTSKNIEPCAATRQDIEQSLEKLKSSFDFKGYDCAIVVDISKQELYLIGAGGAIINSYEISSSKYGTGNRKNSFQTPLGTHRIVRKHGEGAQIGTIFRSRTVNGDMATIVTDKIDTEDDYITTRVMVLKGLEDGVNSGGEVDSYERSIYIHGTHEEGLIGTPASRGCIRMRNTDIAELFSLVPEGTLVEIQR